MEVVDREEVVFNLVSVNQSFVRVIAITFSQFSLKPAQPFFSSKWLAQLHI